jgi:hypothetical protein
MLRDNVLRQEQPRQAAVAGPAKPFQEAPAEKLAPNRPAPVRKQNSAPVWLFSVATIAALMYGVYLAQREEFTPKEGMGYWIGIVGGSLMLVLLAYPLRKRSRFLSRAGSARIWFQLHMMLGIIGPVLILYHCNFSLGDTNSNVALFAMLLVAGSGILGRYIYSKVHNGLYGARSDLNDLLAQAISLVPAIESELGGAGGSVAKQLTKFGERALRQRRSVWATLASAVWLTITVPFARSRIRRAANAALKRNAKAKNWSGPQRRDNLKKAQRDIDYFLNCVTKAAELGFYERLFSLWHVFHVPLFFLLLITGITHVVAVHLY